MSLALSSLVGAIGRAGLRKEVGLLRPGPRWPEGASAPNGTVMCQGHGILEMVTPAIAGFRRRIDALFVSGVVVSCRCHWESRPQEGGGIAQAWATWPEGASAPNGTVMCRGHGVPEMVTPAGRRQFCSFFKLDKYAMFSFAMTSGLASDSDKF